MYVCLSSVYTLCIIVDICKTTEEKSKLFVEEKVGLDGSNTWSYIEYVGLLEEQATLMTLEECYLSILKNSNSWNPTKSHTVEFDWEKMKLKDNHALNSFFVHIMLFNLDLKDYMIKRRKTIKCD